MNPWSTLNLSRNKTNSKERKKEKIHEERNQKKRRRKRRKILTNSWNTISEIWFPDGKTPENLEKEVCKSIIFNLSGICLSNVFLPFPEKLLFPLFVFQELVMPMAPKVVKVGKTKEGRRMTNITYGLQEGWSYL